MPPCLNSGSQLRDWSGDDLSPAAAARKSAFLVSKHWLRTYSDDVWIVSYPKSGR